MNISQIRNDIKAGKHQEAFASLNWLSDRSDDFVLQSKYASFLDAILDSLPELKKIKIAVLSSSTASHFCHILKYWLAKEGLNAEIFESEYDTIHQTVLDPHSPLYTFNPDIAILFTNYRDVRFPVRKSNALEEIQNAVSVAIGDFRILWDALRQNSKCIVIQNNADLPYQRIFGNYEGNILWGQLNMLRHFNLELAKAAGEGIVIFDLDYLSSVYGKQKWHEPRYWYHSKHAFALDASGLVAHEVSKLIGAITGRSKKCIVLDLDNTLWGGVIGDDGLENIRLGNGPDGEAFVDFQEYILQLKERGILLAICSKNDETLAKEPFLCHPDMRIKLEDVVSFKANWEDKVSNIKAIAQELNIGLDTLVFIDDNPAERELVKSMLPMVSVLELPQDPVGYVHALSSQSYFETVTFSNEDKMRSELYRSNAARSGFQKQFTDLTGYLRNLEMEMEVSEVTDFNLSRAVQLINKSNQFHLTTTRYNSNEIQAYRKQKNKVLKCFSLTDCFGDNGLIAAVILEHKNKELSIDTWVMSCRVLSRGVEEFIMQEIVDTGKRLGVERIEGVYFPTRKNQLVKDLYARLRFTLKKEDSQGAWWELLLTGGGYSYQSLIKKSKDKNDG